MSIIYLNFVYVLVFCLISQPILAFPEIGKWEHTYYNVTRELPVTFPKSLYSGSEMYINVGCRPTGEDLLIEIKWGVAEVKCWNDYILSDDIQDVNTSQKFPGDDVKSVCKPSIPVGKYQTPKIESPQDVVSNLNSDNEKKSVQKRLAAGESSKSTNVYNNTGQQPENGPTARKNGPQAVYTVPEDGLYVLQVVIIPQPGQHINVSMEVKMVGPHGYLSAVDWPLLPFYGAMCVVYVIFGIVWLAVSFCQWRDLLRVQFWIGAVILLGMLEKATFYAEYQSLNTTGKSVRAAVLLAELVSCAKRTLARMLVIIVSLGFGIVKPRLGPALHRVILTGSLYMLLAAVESYLRVRQVKDESAGRQLLLASVPLAVLDSAICWWIFSSLAQTTRTLRLRRNLVKLSLYRHFTNTLIFAVVSSLIFMLYSIRYHRLASCLTDWKALWLDDAYWHLLFSLLLLVIMILWRPGNNNQRYAFSPLLDAPEDEDEDEDDEQFVSDAFGVKMRGMNRSNSPKPPKSTNTAEEDLKWVEENIPSSMPDTTLPVLDSDEEIMTTKFEVSKMQ